MYYWKKNRDKKALKDLSSLHIVKNIFENKKSKAGIRSIVMEARRKFGIRINHKKVARLKKDYGLVTSIRKRRPIRYGLDKIFEHAKQKNLLNRNFKPQTLDSVYCTDITALTYGKNTKAYLSAMKDLCSREIVSHRFSAVADLSLSTNLACEVVEKLTAEKIRNLMIYSDQGSHYTSSNYQSILKNAGVTQSTDGPSAAPIFNSKMCGYSLDGVKSIHENKGIPLKLAPYIAQKVYSFLKICFISMSCARRSFF